MKQPANQNVGPAERVASAIAGGYLLYDAIAHRKGLLKTFAAGVMIYRGMSGYCPAYDLMGKRPAKLHNVNIRTEIVIEKPVGFVYDFWRNLENLPLFLSHLKSVKVLDRRLSEWKAHLPGNLGTISWKASIVHEIPREVIGWTSVEGSALDTAGKVTFERVSPNSTKIGILLSYKPSSGKFAERAARLISPSFESSVKNDLAELKDYLEAGFSQNMPTDFRNQLI